MFEAQIDNLTERERLAVPQFFRRVQVKRVAIQQELDVFDARRGILEEAMAANFSSESSHYLVTAITELASNIVFHSRGGWMQVDRIEEPDEKGDGCAAGFCVIASDLGPGIDDLDRALEEGYSTINSLGCGLPGVCRLMDWVHINTQASGTTITATMWKK